MILVINITLRPLEIYVDYIGITVEIHIKAEVGE